MFQSNKNWVRVSNKRLTFEDWGHSAIQVFVALSLENAYIGLTWRQENDYAYQSAKLQSMARQR